MAILPICDNEKKIRMIVACKQNHFDFWNLCKRLQNFVNMEAVIYRTHKVHEKTQEHKPLFQKYIFYTFKSTNNKYRFLKENKGYL